VSLRYKFRVQSCRSYKYSSSWCGNLESKWTKPRKATALAYTCSTWSRMLSLTGTGIKYPGIGMTNQSRYWMFILLIYLPNSQQRIAQFNHQILNCYIRYPNFPVGALLSIHGVLKNFPQVLPCEDHEVSSPLALPGALDFLRFLSRRMPCFLWFCESMFLI